MIVHTPASQASSSSPDRIPHLFDELPDGVLLLGPRGEVEWVNRAFLLMTRRTAEEVLHRPFESLVAEEDMVNLIGFEAIFHEPVVRDAFVIFAAPDGERHPLIVCSQRSCDGLRVLMTARAPGTVQRELADTSRWAAEEQQRAQIVEAAHDALAEKNAALLATQEELAKAYSTLQGELATRERLENELRLAQKLEAIGQLAAGIAHEINTPVQFVSDSVHFLRDANRDVFALVEKLQEVCRIAADPAAATELPAAIAAAAQAEQDADLAYLHESLPRAFERCVDGLERVAVIVRSMKEFAHPAQDEMVAVDLNRAIQSTLTIAANEYKYVATLETDFGELPFVTCHASEINQVVLNLVVNAAHAIADAVKGSDKKGTLGLVTRVDGDHVVLSIRDTGTGIPDAVAHRVFEQFFTTKDVGRGTGQGLALAWAVVTEKHGGELRFDSQVGVGTTFFVRLPITGKPQAR